MTARLHSHPTRVVVILALVLTIGSTGQISSSWAAPSNASINITLNADIIPLDPYLGSGVRTICVGDKVTILVKVSRTILISGGNQTTLETLPGVEIEATAGGLGRISPNKALTTFENDALGTAKFTFLAEQAGTTSIAFKGTIDTRAFLGLKIGGNIITGYRVLTIEDCKYRVTALSRWQVPGPANVKIMAQFWDAGMAQVGAGTGRYEGTAKVSWEGTADRVGDCIETFDPGDSQANLTGQVEGSIRLALDVKYQIAKISSVDICINPNGSGSGQFLKAVTPDTLSVRFPVYMGGQKQLSQVLRMASIAIPGSALLIVMRVINQ